MIGLLQRVRSAHVEVAGEVIGAIDIGLMVLLGVEKNDTQQQVDKLLNRLLHYRVFPDEAGKMNLSLSDIGGGLLLVPQFTLPADTRKGRRPSFSNAASPEQGKKLFDAFVRRAYELHPDVATGQFGADMRVHLINDGPVTFWLQVN